MSSHYISVFILQTVSPSECFCVMCVSHVKTVGQACVTCGWVNAGGDVKVAQCVGVQHVGSVGIVFVLLLGQRTGI